MTTETTTPWIERVREADSHAERAFLAALDLGSGLGTDVKPDEVTPVALIAIAAELRAARIARRPGAGQ